MHAAVSGTRSCWRPFVTHCNPAYKLTSLPFATKLHQARAAYAAHAQSASRLLQDLADVLNEPEVLALLGV